MSLNCARLGRMLRNVRHISEGNFYGLHVTNKANNVSLDRKLKTLDACRDAQNHCYRKEEKDLANTLLRLQKSKDQYHHNDDLILRHFGERPWMKGDREYQEFKQVANKLKNQASNHSIDFPPAPVSSAHNLQTIQQNVFVEQPVSTEVGSAIHRTVGFTDCVICRLPKGSNVKGTDVCRCEKGPDKGTHHMHPAAIHADKTRAEYLHTKERRELYDKLHPKEHGHRTENSHGSREHQDADKQAEREFLAKLHREMQTVIESPLQLGAQDGGINKTIHTYPGRKSSHESSNHSPPGRRGSFGHAGHREHGHDTRRGSSPQDKLQPPHGSRVRYNSLLDDDRYRNRTDSIYEEGAYTVPKGHRKMSVLDPDSTRKRMDSLGGESYYSVGEVRSRAPTNEESQEMLHKTFKITHSSMYPSSSPHDKHQVSTERNVGFTTHGESHLPKLHEHEAFHGLIHPDNIINHHHYLPYEAELHHKKSHHGNHHHSDHHHGDHHHDDYHHHHHDKRHFHGYYIHKYDHTGTRQIAHIPVGANTHISEMLERQREPDSHHLTLLSNLRHLLSVYRRLDETSPRYPWPSPPHPELTKEEFEKLKDCRYLRLPKALEEPPLTPVFHNKNLAHNGD